MKTNNKNNAVIFILATVVVLILVNLISLRSFFRIDLTRDQKFTLSDASRNTVARLEDVLTVTAYFTEGLPPPYAQNARYVHDLLQEYHSAAAGKFAFEFMDPTQAETQADREKKKNIQRDIFGRVMRESTSVERQLADMGIQPVEIRVIEGDAQQTKRAYMGLVIRYQDKFEVIPIVQNISDLEKDLTSLMRKLVRIRTPQIGLIYGGFGSGIEKLKEAMLQNVEIQNVDLKAEGAISDSLDALLIIGSGDHFGESGAKKIDDFLSLGKSATFLLDRYQIDPRSFSQVPSKTNSSVEQIFDLLKKYGVEIASGLVADATCASLSVQEQRGGFNFAMPIKYPFVPEILNLSYESPISKGLTGVILPFTSEIILTAKPGLNAQVIAQSSKISWIENEPFNLNPKRNWGEADITPDGPHQLMVELRGQLPKESIELEENKKPVESRIVVAGTSAFVWDDFISPPNMLLALNMVDWMIADTALLQMRSRNFQEAPIRVDISDGAKVLVKFGNIFGVPLLLIFYGLIRWRRREKKRRTLRLV